MARVPYGHGGHVRALAARAGVPVSAFLDFSASINPLGPPEWLRGELSAHVSELVHYPDPDCSALVAAAARSYAVSEDEVVASAGSTELLRLLPDFLRPSRAVAFVPCYSDYLAPCRAAGVETAALALDPSAGFLPDLARLEEELLRSPGACIAYLGQPNNPTGRTLPAPAVRALARRHPGTLFVVDEAFADFVPGLDRLTTNRPPNVLTLLSLTKFYAVPGLRLGLALADPGLAARLRTGLPTWSVSSLAQAVGARALADAEYARRSVEAVAAWRGELAASLAGLPGLTVFPGEANFLLVRTDPSGPDAAELAQRLLADGLAIRSCANFEGLGSNWFRVAVRCPEDNGRLAAALGKALGRPRSVARPSRRTPAIMLQGTSSNAGKSLLAAALCRILLQDGYRVAPFKSQNMSLNSFVTLRGEEMGRAQVLQAQACRLDPDCRMNPVLLKPTTDMGSQVIVLGRPVGNMRVAEYIRYKPEAFARARQAYDELAAGHDVMVLEGAGSPAEVNLKAHDIVNMAMARHAGARVLLVGDIDRGGVFASLLGTMECLEERERALVGGYILNKFRGDASLLDDAMRFLAERTGVPTLGVVEYLRDLGLPEEDSVSFKDGAGAVVAAMAGGPEVLDIACLDLPHISNFTDLDPLRPEPGVRVRVVRRERDLGRPDAVIIPGSKNTLADLDWLRESGLAAAVERLAGSGRCEVVGICGGFQMLGRDIDDSIAQESRGGRNAPGLGLLPLSTAMAREKTLRRTRCRHLESGLEVTGYEIHHGLTKPCPDLAGTNSAVPLFLEIDSETGGEIAGHGDGEPAGYGTPSGLIWGGYLHGLFEADLFRHHWLNGLRRRRGLPELDGPTTIYDVEPGLERLAKAVRASLDMGAVYRLLGL